MSIILDQNIDESNDVIIFLLVKTREIILRITTREEIYENKTTFLS